MSVIEVSEGDFKKQVLDRSHQVPVVVDFWAGWCRPCLVLGPVLERLAGEHEGRFVLAKVDVDANPALAQAFGVQGIPAVKAFREGAVADEFVGAQPEEVVRSFLRGIVPSEAEGIVSEGAEAEEGGDLEAAERAYRSALEADPGHTGATLGLARVLLAGGQSEEALRLIERVPGEPEARRLRAEASLRAEAPADGDLARLREDGSPEALVRLARGLAAAGEHREALERALDAVSLGGEQADAGREVMVAVFDVLGEDDPLTREFRPRLASAIF